MRTILDTKQMLVSVVGAVFDSAAIYIANMLGLPGWLSLIIGFIPSMLLDKYIQALVDRLLKPGRAFAFSVIACVLAGTGYLLQKYGDVNIWINLPYYVLPGIAISLISMIVIKHKIRKAAQRVQESFEGKNGEITVDRNFALELLESHKGENREITAEYEKETAVKCENGIFIGRKTDGVIAFKGIPYAKPPVGSLRWKAPQEPEPSEKVFEAFYFGKTEPQLYHNYTQAALYDMSEDCLTLNIWKAEGAGEKLPVMVWTDTYDWCTGGTATILDDGSEFVKENTGVLFVSINFRLGLFGNMDFSGVPGGEEYEDSRNLGLQDQAEALRWLHRNIENFGGDPDNVTVAGICGGGVSALLLSIMPETKGLFSKAVCLGASIRYTNDMESFRIYQKNIREYLKAETMEDCLKLTPEQLARAIDEPEFWLATLPVRDGKTVPFDIEESFRRGGAREIGLLISTAKQESMLVGSVTGNKAGLTENFKEYIDAEYKSLPEEKKRCLGQYMKAYYHSPSGDMLMNSDLITELAVHCPMLRICQAQTEAGGESRYLVWNIASPVKDVGATSLTAAIVLLKKTEHAESCGVVGDPLVFRSIRRMFVNYLMTGDPSLNEGEISNVQAVSWPPYSSGNKEVMVFDGDGLQMDHGNLSERIGKLCAPFIYPFQEHL